jgi:hypothetical protein
MPWGQELRSNPGSALAHRTGFAAHPSTLHRKPIVVATVSGGRGFPFTEILGVKKLFRSNDVRSRLRMLTYQRGKMISTVANRCVRPELAAVKLGVDGVSRPLCESVRPLTFPGMLPRPPSPGSGSNNQGQGEVWRRPQGTRPIRRVPSLAEPWDAEWLSGLRSKVESRSRAYPP